MGLTATLTASLDCRSLGGALTASLDTGSGSLGAVSLQLPPGPLGDVNAAAGSVDANPVAAAAAQLAGRIPQALAALPGLDGVMAPITRVVALAGEIAANDVPTLFQQVLDRLRAELANPSGGGHAALLLRLADLLTAAPEGRSLVQLAGALLPQLELGSAAAFPFLDILRGVEGATQILGGLMCLQTVLAEADRLAATMSVRLDPAAALHRIQTLSDAIGSGADGLAARLAAVNAGDAGALARLVDAVVAAAAGLAELRELYAVGLAMDEATLAYVDIAALQAEIDAARAMIRSADAAPARRAVDALAAQLGPLLAFRLPATPADGIAALIAAAEAQVAGVAAEIDALDLGVVTDPLASGLQLLTQPLRDVQGLIDGVLLNLRSALDSVRAAVAALPLDDLAATIRSFMAPVAAALAAVRTLLDGVQAALEAAGDASGAALGAIETALDAFQQQIDAFFDQAQQALDALNLDQAVAAIAGGVQQFSDALGQAQMQPYFDTAVGAIDTATEVVEAVPIGLLPDSMKAEVDAAVAPIRAVDADAVQQEIETALGITPDGRFALRGDLEAAIAEVQQKFAQVLALAEANSPRTLLADVDARIDELAEQVRAIEPALTLAPVREAVDSVRAAVEGIDLDALLQPLRDAFGQITAALDGLSVAALVAPVQQRIDDARGAVLQALRLEQWDTALQTLRTEALALLGRVQPQALRAPLEDAFAELSAVLARFPAFNAGAGMGVVVAGMLGASGRRIQPSSFGPVLGWIGGGASAGTALAAYSRGIAESLDRAAALADAMDPALAASALNARYAQLAAAVQALSVRVDAGNAATLRATLPLLDSAAIFGELAAQRARYRQSLDAARAAAGAFQRSGFSEADVGVAALQQVLQPLQPARDALRALLRSIGLDGPEIGVAPVLRMLLAAAPPARLVGIAMPVFDALQRRLMHLLDAVIDPLLAAATDLRALLAAFSLTPLVDAADAVVAQARAEIDSLHPDQLLAAPLAEFAALRSAIVDNDPLDAVTALLEALREQIARVLDKLSLERMLQTPLAIYDGILADLKTIDPGALLTPVFDQIDAIALQVDTGLDQTIASFKRLQDALPSGGGGGGLGGGISVGGSIDF